jgi:hypothetical protein
MDRSATECAYQKIQALMAAFEKKHGSTQCRVLVDGCDFMTPEGQSKYKERNMMRNQCAGCVATVSESLDSLLK